MFFAHLSPPSPTSALSSAYVPMMTPVTALKCVLIFACLGRSILCGPGQVAAQPDATVASPGEPPTIGNLIAVTQRIVSGARPAGEQAFAALRDRGIRTIVSVDGVPPDVEAARRVGLRYVHVPVGYDGISPEAVASLTRVTRDCEGPIFVHCHHGRHRGPAAAAVLAMIEGDLSREQSLQFLQRAGTSRDYPGLWRAVSTFRPLPVDAPLAELAEVAGLKPLVEAMVRIDSRLEVLRSYGAAGQTIDAAAATESALLVGEEFREWDRRLDPATSSSLRPLILSAASAADSLYRDLQGGADRSEVASQLRQLEKSCVACHRVQRDVVTP